MCTVNSSRGLCFPRVFDHRALFVESQSPAYRTPRGNAADVVFFKDVHKDTEQGKPHQSDIKQSRRKWRQHIAALAIFVYGSSLSAGGLLAPASHHWRGLYTRQVFIYTELLPSTFLAVAPHLLENFKEYLHVGFPTRWFQQKLSSFL